MVSTESDLDHYAELVDYSAADHQPTLQWSRHDRTHLEISFDYLRTGGASTQLEWEAYYFIPETFHLNADSYSKREIFGDLRSYVRLSIPDLEFHTVGQEAQSVADRLESQETEAAVAELKLFGARCQRSIVEASTLVASSMDEGEVDDPAALIESFLLTATEQSQLAHTALEEVGSDSSLDVEVAQAAAWVDEYLSRSFERCYVRVARREAEGELASAAAIDEARYRRKNKSGPISSAEGSNLELERVERRLHSLKRFTSSVLWLDVEIAKANQWAEHVLHALAAGIAMAFAVIATIAYGNPGDASQLWVWGILVVMAYMAKDRIKVMLQRAFDAVLADRFADRRWSVRRGSNELAEVSEKVQFIERQKLPDEVNEIRTEAYRDTLQEQSAPDSILHHRKQIRLRPQAIAAVDDRFDSLTEVLRMDVTRWLAHTDDAKRKVTMADPDRRELFTSKLPRAYDVIAVFRLTEQPEVASEWKAVRFVVTRSGIRRIGELASGSS